MSVIQIWSNICEFCSISVKFSENIVRKFIYLAYGFLLVHQCCKLWTSLIWLCRCFSSGTAAPGYTVESRGSTSAAHRRQLLESSLHLRCSTVLRRQSIWSLRANRQYACSEDTEWRDRDNGEKEARQRSSLWIEWSAWIATDSSESLWKRKIARK